MVPILKKAPPELLVIVPLFVMVPRKLVKVLPKLLVTVPPASLLMVPRLPMKPSLIMEPSLSMMPILSILAPKSLLIVPLLLNVTLVAILNLSPPVMVIDPVRSNWKLISRITSEVTTPLPSIVILSVLVGKVSPLQFAESDQVVPSPPPSQVTVAASACGTGKKNRANIPIAMANMAFRAILVGIPAFKRLR